MPSTPHQLSKDSDDANMMYILYRTLLGQSAALTVTTTEFRQAMSLAFGPDPNWALPCNIAQPSLEIPPLLNYFAPPGEKCSHCNLSFHEEHRCYSKDPRNMYRYPPNDGWSNGIIPPWYIRTYNKPRPAFNSLNTVNRDTHLVPTPSKATRLPIPTPPIH
jgi:hypothetical protein